MTEILENSRRGKKRAIALPNNEFFSENNAPKKADTVEAYSKNFRRYYEATVQATSGKMATISYTNGTTDNVPLTFLRPLQKKQQPESTLEAHKEMENSDNTIEASVEALGREKLLEASPKRHIDVSFEGDRNPMLHCEEKLDVSEPSDDFYVMNQVARGAFYYFTFDKASKNEGIYHLGKLIRLFEKTEGSKKDIWAHIVPVEKAFRHVLHGQFMFPGVELEEETKAVEVPVTYLRSDNRIKVISKEDLHRAFVLIE